MGYRICRNRSGARREFTAPYVLIEGTHMVPADSPLKTISDVDRPGVRIAIGLGSAYDLYVTPHDQIRHHRSGRGSTPFAFYERKTFATRPQMTCSLEQKKRACHE